MHRHPAHSAAILCMCTPLQESVSASSCRALQRRLLDQILPYSSHLQWLMAPAFVTWWELRLTVSLSFSLAAAVCSGCKMQADSLSGPSVPHSLLYEWTCSIQKVLSIVP